MFSVRKFRKVFLCILCTGLFLVKAEFSNAETQKVITSRDQFFDVAVVKPSHAWVVGYFGLILHTKDAGKTWEMQESGTRNALFSVSFSDPNNGWSVGDAGTILHTGNGGKEWVLQESGTEQPLLSVHFINHDIGWAVGYFGTILRTNNGGRSWEDRSLGEDIVLNDVFFTSPHDGWIVGEFGTILNNSGGGASWAVQESGVGEVSLFGLNFIDHLNGWVVGQDGVVLRTLDGGKTWIRQESDTDRHLFSVDANGKMVRVVGLDGTYVEINQNEQMCSKTIAFTWLRSVAFFDDLRGITVGGHGIILLTEDGGINWKIVGP